MESGSDLKQESYLQARVESELQQLDESEESKEFESEELKLKLVPGDLGLDDLELVPEALEGLEGLELKRLSTDLHKHGKQQPLWGQTSQKLANRGRSGGHSGARPHETLASTDLGAW